MRFQAIFKVCIWTPLKTPSTKIIWVLVFSKIVSKYHESVDCVHTVGCVFHLMMHLASFGGLTWSRYIASASWASPGYTSWKSMPGTRHAGQMTTLMSWKSYAWQVTTQMCRYSQETDQRRLCVTDTFTTRKLHRHDLSEGFCVLKNVMKPYAALRSRLFHNDAAPLSFVQQKSARQILFDMEYV